MSIIKSIYFGLLATFATVTIAAAPASAQQQKPNILVIMGDDIGYWNISAPPALYDEAKKNGWTVISMKNDWKRIFAFDN